MLILTGYKHDANYSPKQFSDKEGADRRRSNYTVFAIDKYTVDFGYAKSSKSYFKSLRMISKKYSMSYDSWCYMFVITFPIFTTDTEMHASEVWLS